ncbi:hypothetical protein CEXT_754961 [Caerostris extrusa]|uniref:CCHC-type domain-containing protein n=1 Tax=Caerostris extrusa TaxID=172846 RepID=A0AAV4TKV2_CAEEX|nr:hypothetical protein CEXT_754961 [Caerostris extrusa]
MKRSQKEGEKSSFDLASKSIKCFRCNNFGHESSQCLSVQPEVINELTIVSSKLDMHKIVSIDSNTFEYLIHTGSPVRLVRENGLPDSWTAIVKLYKIKVITSGKSQIQPPFFPLKPRLKRKIPFFETDIWALIHS